MNKHTPGPWMVLDFRGHPDGEWIAIASNVNSESPEVIARIRNEVSGKPLDDIDYSNAKLIAAAPALLEACEMAMAACKTNIESYERDGVTLLEAYHACRTAIESAKVTDV